MKVFRKLLALLVTSLPFSFFCLAATCCIVAQRSAASILYGQHIVAQGGMPLGACQLVWAPSSQISDCPLPCGGFQVGQKLLKGFFKTPSRVGNVCEIISTSRPYPFILTSRIPSVALQIKRLELPTPKSVRYQLLDQKDLLKPKEYRFSFKSDILGESIRENLRMMDSEVSMDCYRQTEVQPAVSEGESFDVDISVFPAASVSQLSEDAVNVQWLQNCRFHAA